MIEDEFALSDELGFFDGKPVPDDFDWDAWKAERQRVLDEYEEWLLSPF